jgi:hypothetical protein
MKNNQKKREEVQQREKHTHLGETHSQNKHT